MKLVFTIFLFPLYKNCAKKISGKKKEIFNAASLKSKFYHFSVKSENASIKAERTTAPQNAEANTSTDHFVADLFTVLLESRNRQYCAVIHSVEEMLI